MREARMWIGGEWSESGAWAQGQDPCTGEDAYRYAVAGPNEVRQAVAAARRAQPAWAESPWSTRRGVLRRALHLMVDRIDEISDTILLETGKPPCESVGGAEIPTGLECLAYYAAETERVLRPRAIRTRFRPYFFGKSGRVYRKPLGVIGAITPWNLPFSLAMGAIVPALAAGNAVVVKPSEHAPLTALEIARAFADAGLPAGLLNVVPGGPATGAALVASQTDRIVFIGSVATGASVARALADACRRPPLLELGGKDAMVVCVDADVAYAAQGAVWNAFSNTGQFCCSVERVYVARDVAGAFVDRALQATARLTELAGFVEHAGRLHAPATHWAFGPLISESARQRVHRHVTDAVERGARLLAGGRIPEGPGFWYPPTVLADVTDEMLVMREETFGPVLPVVAVADEEEAVTRSNASPRALTGSVWTRDLKRGRRLADQMRACLAMVNDHASAYAMLDCPWGGSGSSGWGRLHGPDALCEVTEACARVVDRVPTSKVWWYPYTRPAYEYFRRGSELLFAGRLRQRLGAAGPVVRALLAGRRQPGLGG
ncbi:MAG: aldehyde dehydrogenase family protein [Armatimonadetes bacterium]|nr:aldehyde dehydrogenase family protein [Armatimonadota bacterium]